MCFVLSDVNDKTVGQMITPSGKQGLETLSFVAEPSARFILSIEALDAQAAKGVYTLWREASRPATAQDQRRVQVQQLFVRGMVASLKRQEEIAIEHLLEAQAGWQELADTYMVDLTAGSIRKLKLVRVDALREEALALRQEGTEESLRGALLKYQVMHRLYHDIDDRMGEAVSLVMMGRCSSDLGEKTAALRFYEEALSLFEALRDKSWEAITLNNIGLHYSDIGEKNKALEYFEQVLAVRRASGVSHENATTLNNIGTVYADLGEHYKSLEYFNQALSLDKDAGDKKGQAVSLNNIGSAYGDLGEQRKALNYYTQALALLKELGDRRAEATTLHNIGVSYHVIGESQKTLDYLSRGLALAKDTGDQQGQAQHLTSLGRVHHELGEKRKALDYYNQALARRQALNDKSGEAATLTGIGSTYSALGEKHKALDYFNQSLLLRKQVGDKSGEATTLHNIGMVYSDLGEKQKALEHYNQALSLRKAVNDKGGEATTLHNIGAVYFDLGETYQALSYFSRALSLSRVVGDRTQEADTLTFMMLVWGRLNNRGISIFYGKQSINKFQELRQAIAGLKKETQRSFLSQFELSYKALAEILIAEGRLLEAEQVLAMLKEEEVFDYLRRDASETSKLQQRADLTPAEAAALKRYNEIADRITALGEEFNHLDQLKRKGIKLTEEQEKRRRELSQQIQDANHVFDVFLREVADEFAKRPHLAGDINESTGLRFDFESWGKGVVFLYTLVGEDRYRVVLIARKVKTDGKSEIKAAALDDKIEAFRQTVQDPHSDPRPLGKELYDILIKPIEKQLEGAKADTLLWSLDGNLRLLPLAALWDGKQYFGQKYKNVIVTRASLSRLGKQPRSNWRALALGVSKPQVVRDPNGVGNHDFGALPAVKDELLSIVQGPRSPNGVMPGQSLIDDEFNELALENELARGYKVVHIASHFSLNPGNSTKSFLLLGDGGTLTVEDIRTNPQLEFAGVELLTLSACQTALVGKDSSGQEIEGFGYVAQTRGAKAILATLWRVADESTQILMSRFYRLRKENPQLTKADVLQLAQIEMIEGKLTTSTISRQTGDWRNR